MNFIHSQIGKVVRKLGSVPTDEELYDEWIRAEAHLRFLEQNARSDELVIYASSMHLFVHAVAVPNDKLTPLDTADLLGWSYSVPSSVASYVTGGGRDDVWVEREWSTTGARSLRGATPLLFSRYFEGWSDPDASYFELHQELAHLAEIHWRPEARAYCRFDDNGDLEPVVTITRRHESGGDFTLVSSKWRPLEHYLAANDMSLVRLFDFTLLRHADFNGWPMDIPEEIVESPNLAYRQKIAEGHAAYTRGFQVVRPRRTAVDVAKDMQERWGGRGERKYATFVAYDWRHRTIREISTDPSATTNYFEAEKNDLPFELSPAFFRPEVLLKYKGDRDKYTVLEREVSCRAAWRLQAIHINDAGQIHAYICYLRHLPYSEQLHWLSYNEDPKAGISAQAVATDFEGRWATQVAPLEAVLQIARRWEREKVRWWTLRDPRLIERVTSPVTASRDEWAEAFLDLSKLLIEGFVVKEIRARLTESGSAFEKDAQSIALLEKLVSASTPASEAEAHRLEGLRTVQSHRSKTKGHVGGSEGDQLALAARRDHGSFARHFEHVCGLVVEDLEAVESLFP